MFVYVYFGRDSFWLTRDTEKGRPVWLIRRAGWEGSVKIIVDINSMAMEISKLQGWGVKGKFVQFSL